MAEKRIDVVVDRDGYCSTFGPFSSSEAARAALEQKGWTEVFHHGDSYGWRTHSNRDSRESVVAFIVEITIHPADELPVE